MVRRKPPVLPLGRVSSRQALWRVRDAYVQGGEGALQAAFADVRWRTRGFRALLATVERFYPMSGLIRFAGEVDRGIRAWGLSSACRTAAERLYLPYEVSIPPATRAALSENPLIIYGNHPTLFTPFLVGAAVERPDLRFFMLSYVGRLIPAIRAYMLPLEVSAPRQWTEWRRGGTRRLIAHWLTQALEKGRAREEPKSANRRMLMQGVEHVRQGGCVVIFPSGGGRGNPRWYPGIGVVASELARDPAAANVRLVPMREEESTNRHVYQSFCRVGRPAAPQDVGGLPSIRVRFGNPVRLLDLVSPEDAPGKAAIRLQAHYAEIFPPTERRAPRKSLFLRRRPIR